MDRQGLRDGGMGVEIPVRGRRACFLKSYVCKDPRPLQPALLAIRSPSHPELVPLLQLCFHMIVFLLFFEGNHSSEPS